MRRQYLCTATVAAGILALAGCAHAGTARATSGASPALTSTPVAASSPPVEPPVQPPNPARAVAAAGQSTARAGSARFRGEGAYDFARRQGSLQVEFPQPGSPAVGLLCPPAGSTPVVIDHDVVYEKIHGFAKPWTRAQPKPSENFFDPAQVLSSLPKGSTVTTVGPDTQRGAATTHYRVQLTGTPGSADIWLDEQGRVRKLASSASGQLPISFTYEFYDFGTPVTVTIPPADQVQPIGNG